MTGRSGVRVRVAAYAVATVSNTVLLTRLRGDDPDGGKWTLPGGGVDFGEHPLDALHREVYEETGLRGPVGRFLGVDSVVIEPHPIYAMDRVHAIRLVYAMDLSGEPRLVEVGGSTVAVAWVDLGSVRSLERVELVDAGLAMAGITVG